MGDFKNAKKNPEDTRNVSNADGVCKIIFCVSAERR